MEPAGNIGLVGLNRSHALAGSAVEEAGWFWLSWASLMCWRCGKLP